MRQRDGRERQVIHAVERGGAERNGSNGVYVGELSLPLIPHLPVVTWVWERGPRSVAGV